VTKGSVVLQDSCSLNRLGDGIDYVYEAYCDSSGNPRQIYYACLFGCDSSLRACKSSAPNQEYFEFGVGSSGISQSVNKTIAPGSSATFEAHVCFDPLNTVTRPVNLGTGQCPSSSTCSGALNGKVEGNCKYYNFTISTTAQTPLGHNTISVYGDAAGKIRYGALFNVNIQSQTPPPSSGGICSDSDVTTQYPDGKNWFTVGNTSLSPTNSTVDYCISSSLIREYYCDTPNTRNSVVQNCTQLGANYFCFQGKCA
jgi:hypothetical protein